jgi:hypothetical protein
VTFKEGHRFLVYLAYTGNVSPGHEDDGEY